MRGNADPDALPRAIQQFPVRAVGCGRGRGLRAAQALREALDSGKVPAMEAQAGQVVDLGKDPILPDPWASGSRSKAG